MSGKWNSGMGGKLGAKIYNVLEDIAVRKMRMNSVSLKDKLNKTGT